MYTGGAATAISFRFITKLGCAQVSTSTSRSMVSRERLEEAAYDTADEVSHNYKKKATTNAGAAVITLTILQ